jgi:tetratricopeptide (TPR) repeat protein/transcriptional regulator with XRE-family HTH domain
VAVSQFARLGALLKHHRLTAGLTQEELAARADVSVRSISDLENGRQRTPYRYTVQRLADALALGGADRAEFKASSRRFSAAGSLEPVPTELEAGSRRLPIGGYLGSVPSGALIGRQAELHRMVVAIDEVPGGTGRTMLLAGEPGVGKTRLAQELTLRLHDRGFVIATGRSYEAEQSIPYYSFLDVLTTILHAAPSALRAEAPKRWPYLGVVLRDEVGMPRLTGRPGADEMPWVLRAVAGFIEAAADTVPLALVLDDLHWADGATLKLLLYLSRRTRSSRVLLLGCFRDLEVHRQPMLAAALTEMEREGLMDRILVECLGEGDTRGLIASTLNEENVSEEFARLVHGHTDGNPFFVQQVMRMLVDRGDVFRRDGAWDRKAIFEIEVPGTVRAVIAQRLARLAGATQATLREASVLGQIFQFDDLQRMGGRAETEIEAALDEAAAAGLLKTADGETYGFDHALTQHALYGELSPRHRRRLHLAAGEAIEAGVRRESGARVEELARHFVRAGDRERALAYSLRAGDEAEAVFAHGEAEQHFRTALELARAVDDPALAAQAAEKLGIVLFMATRHAEAIKILDEAQALYRRLRDFEGEMQIAGWLAWSHYRRNEFRQALDRLLPVLERWRANPAPSWAASQLHRQLSTNLIELGQPEEAPDFSRCALTMARDIGDDRATRESLFSVGLSLWGVGRYAESAEVFCELTALAETSGDVETLEYGLAVLSQDYHGLGQIEKAWSTRERQIQLTRQVGDRDRIAFGLAQAAALAFYTGDWDRAQAFADEAADYARGPQGRYTSLAPGFAAWLRLVREETPEALATLETLAGADMTPDGPATEQQPVAFLSSWLLRSGESHAALTRAEAAIPRLPPSELWLINLRQVATEARVEVGDYLEAASRITTGLETAIRRHWLLEVPAWLRIRAKLMGRQERWEEARAAFQEALARTDMPRNLPERAIVLQDYGEILASAHERDEAQERLNEALSLCVTLGARAWSRSVERSLQTLSAPIR